MDQFHGRPSDDQSTGKGPDNATTKGGAFRRNSSDDSDGHNVSGGGFGRSTSSATVRPRSSIKRIPSTARMGRTSSVTFLTPEERRKARKVRIDRLIQERPKEYFSIKQSLDFAESSCDFDGSNPQYERDLLAFSLRNKPQQESERVKFEREYNKYHEKIEACKKIEFLGINIGKPRVFKNFAKDLQEDKLLNLFFVYRNSLLRNRGGKEGSITNFKVGIKDLSKRINQAKNVEEIESILGEKRKNSTDQTLLTEILADIIERYKTSKSVGDIKKLPFPIFKWIVLSELQLMGYQIAYLNPYNPAQKGKTSLERSHNVRDSYQAFFSSDKSGVKEREDVFNAPAYYTRVAREIVAPVVDNACLKQLESLHDKGSLNTALTQPSMEEFISRMPGVTFGADDVLSRTQFAVSKETDDTVFESEERKNLGLRARRIYFRAGTGGGKTWLLQRIKQKYHDELGVLDVIAIDLNSSDKQRKEIFDEVKTFNGEKATLIALDEAIFYTEYFYKTFLPHRDEGYPEHFGRVHSGKSEDELIQEIIQIETAGLKAIKDLRDRGANVLILGASASIDKVRKAECVRLDNELFEEEEKLDNFNKEIDRKESEIKAAHSALAKLKEFYEKEYNTKTSTGWWGSLHDERQNLLRIVNELNSVGILDEAAMRALMNEAKGSHKLSEEEQLVMDNAAILRNIQNLIQVGRNLLQVAAKTDSKKKFESKDDESYIKELEAAQRDLNEKIDDLIKGRFFVERVTAEQIIEKQVIKDFLESRERAIPASRELGEVKKAFELTITLVDSLLEASKSEIASEFRKEEEIFNDKGLIGKRTGEAINIINQALVRSTKKQELEASIITGKEELITRIGLANTASFFRRAKISALDEDIAGCKLQVRKLYEDFHKKRIEYTKSRNPDSKTAAESKAEAALEEAQYLFLEAQNKLVALMGEKEAAAFFVKEQLPAFEPTVYKPKTIEETEKGKLEAAVDSRKRKLKARIDEANSLEAAMKSAMDKFDSISDENFVHLKVSHEARLSDVVDNQLPNFSGKKSQSLQYIMPDFDINQESCQEDDLAKIQSKSKADIIIVPQIIRKKDGTSEMGCRVYHRKTAGSNEFTLYNNQDGTADQWDDKTIISLDQLDGDEARGIRSVYKEIAKVISPNNPNEVNVISFFSGPSKDKSYAGNVIGGNYITSVGVTGQILHFNDPTECSETKIMQLFGRRRDAKGISTEEIDRKIVYHKLAGKAENAVGQASPKQTIRACLQQNTRRYEKAHTLAHLQLKVNDSGSTKVAADIERKRARDMRILEDYKEEKEEARTLSHELEEKRLKFRDATDQAAAKAATRAQAVEDKKHEKLTRQSFSRQATMMTSQAVSLLPVAQEEEQSEAEARKRLRETLDGPLPETPVSDQKDGDEEEDTLDSELDSNSDVESEDYRNEDRMEKVRSIKKSIYEYVAYRNTIKEKEQLVIEGDTADTTKNEITSDILQFQAIKDNDRTRTQVVIDGNPYDPYDDIPSKKGRLKFEPMRMTLKGLNFIENEDPSKPRIFGEGAELHYLNCNDCCFIGVDFSKLKNFETSRFRNCFFQNCIFNENMKSSQFEECRFTKLKASETELIDYEVEDYTEEFKAKLDPGIVGNPASIKTERTDGTTTPDPSQVRDPHSVNLAWERLRSPKDSTKTSH